MVAGIEEGVGEGRAGVIMKSSIANVGDQNHTVCFKGGLDSDWIDSDKGKRSSSALYTCNIRSLLFTSN